MLWLLGAYTELVKLTSIRTQAKNQADYYAQLQGLTLSGGGFYKFDALANEIDQLIEQVNPQDEVAVGAVVVDIKKLFATIDWLPRPFAEVLNGKTYLPKNKLRLSLLKRNSGFMGQGEFRRHFFGESPSVSALVKLFVREKMKYSASTLMLKKRFNLS